MTDPLSWHVTSHDTSALAAFLREKLPGRSWADVKRLVTSGKVRVGGEVALDPGLRLRPGDEVAVVMSSPRPRPRGDVRLVHDDSQVVVVDKPAGIMSVPYERGDRATALDLVREAWRRLGRPVAPLFVVHRIDKDTSGLLVFAKTRAAETALGRQFRAHAVLRSYVCAAHGEVAPMTIESTLVPDRGDGLRGSSSRGGKRAVTHVEPMQPLRGATLCEVRLETGRTHQIRIHLAEAGHPLIGERVYVRDAARAGMALIASRRLLLHAGRLGFEHPVRGGRLQFESPLPSDFREELAPLLLR